MSTADIVAQTLATGGASSLGSLGKGLIAVAKSLGDDFLRTFIKTYGDDAVRAIAAYGDDAAKLALNSADDATKLLLSSGDDLSKTALSYGDDIGKPLASTGDKMIDDWYGLVDNTVDGAASSWDDVANSLDDVADDALAAKPNTGYNGITTEGAGNVGQYTQKIKWGIQDVEVRPAGKGFFGQRTQQINPRVDAYELKINPNNESYYLKSPAGGYVQYENMVNDVVMDGKLVIQQKSFYHVNDLPDFARNKVLQEAMRQVEAANNVGYTVEWLVSDPKAVAQLTDFFKSKNINIVVKYFPE